jgi:hypothetical protein
MPDESTRIRHTRELWCLVTVGLAFLLQLFVLYRPQLARFTHFPLAVPDPFVDVPRLRHGALLLLFVGGALAVTLGIRYREALVARPRLAVFIVYLFGVAFHVGFLASLAGSPLAMERRALLSGHGEYLTEGAAVEDLGATLKNYEPYVRGHVYLANKGPGVLVLFRGLNVLANAAPVRGWLEPVAPSVLVLRWWLAERGEVMTRPQMERLRHLLALVLVIYPFVTLLPVFLIAWVGRVLVDEGFGLLSAQLYTLVPAVALLVAHLDYALFPLCVIGIVAPFVVGVHTKRPWLVAVSGLAFALYFTLTLAALSLVAMLAAYLGLAAIRRLRQGGASSVRLRLEATAGQVLVLDVAKSAVAFAVPAALVVLLISVTLPFHPVERYSVARDIQRTWTSADYNLFWVTTNVLGYLLSFGLMQAVLLIIQQGSSLRRSLSSAGDAVDDLALAWVCLVIALVTVGRNHGETNRIWAFLSPMACLFVGKYFYDRLSSRRLWVPLVAALGAVILVRYRLSYF